MPSIKLNSNFEDRFGKDLEEITLYLYEDSNGSITWSLTNDYKGDEEIKIMRLRKMKGLNLIVRLKMRL